jgi:hypothetical protein
MHNPSLSQLLARTRIDDFRRQAAHRQRARDVVLVPGVPRRPSEVTLRYAVDDDAVALERLAALDESPMPLRPLLVAEVAGELWAALSLSDGSVIADPFFPTVAFVALLRTRAAQLAGAGARESRLAAALGRSARRLARRRLA